MDSRDRGGRSSRRAFLKGMFCSALTMLGVGGATSACSRVSDELSRVASPQTLLLLEASPVPAIGVLGVGDLPAGTSSIRLAALGEFSFDPTEITTLRPDVLVSPHFSVFDVVAHLGAQGLIDLAYHYDHGMDTHVIDSIRGPKGEYEDWWYRAYYAGGWSERNVFRMDHFPYKNGMTIELYLENSDTFSHIHQAFREEVDRLEANDGQVILPELIIETRDGISRFEDVLVSAHNPRSDVLQPGVITALDALLSLRDRGQLEEVGLNWHEQIGLADPVHSYFVEKLNQAQALGSCGFVYETGPRRFEGFMGSHIHLPSDVRITVSPDYAYWYWICL